MIKIKVKASGSTLQILNQIRNPEPYLKAVAIEMIGVVAERIHEEGKASDGNQIGTYSKGYMVVRTGNYKNKGKKDAGFRTKGKDAIFDIKSRKAIKVEAEEGLTKGSLRPNYNRDNDTKVIASLTRQLENDYAVVATTNGWAIGFNTKLSFDKARWVENTYKKKIWSFTNQESEMAKEKIKRELQKISSGINT